MNQAYQLIALLSIALLMQSVAMLMFVHALSETIEELRGDMEAGRYVYNELCKAHDKLKKHLKNV